MNSTCPPRQLLQISTANYKCLVAKHIENTQITEWLDAWACACRRNRQMIASVSMLWIVGVANRSSAQNWFLLPCISIFVHSRLFQIRLRCRSAHENVYKHFARQIQNYRETNNRDNNFSRICLLRTSPDRATGIWLIADLCHYITSSWYGSCYVCLLFLLLMSLYCINWIFRKLSPLTCVCSHEMNRYCTHTHTYSTNTTWVFLPLGIFYKHNSLNLVRPANILLWECFRCDKLCGKN